jgi:hypothetical protein
LNKLTRFGLFEDTNFLRRREIIPLTLMEMDDDSSASAVDSITYTKTTASSVSSLPATKGQDVLLGSRVRIDLELAEFLSENVAAKIWRVAAGHLEQEVFAIFSLSFPAPGRPDIDKSSLVHRLILTTCISERLGKLP